MAVTDVIAKMYDAEPAKVSSPVTASENGFAETVAVAVENQEKNGECGCKSANVDSDGKTGEVAAQSSADTQVSEVNHSAMVKFTMFIRVSSSLGAVQEGLIDQFKEATRKFVNALKEDSGNDVPVLDSYLSQADASAAAGLQSSKSFIDSILSAADSGLKMITSQMSGSSWMTGLNTSANTGGFPTVSSVDIAKLQIQNALEANKSQTTGAGKVTYSSGHTLELIKGIADPIKVDPKGQASAANAVDAASDKVITTKDQPAAGTASRHQLFDKFLEFVENFSSGLLNKGSITRAAFSISYSSMTHSAANKARADEQMPDQAQVDSELNDWAEKAII